MAIIMVAFSATVITSSDVGKTSSQQTAQSQFISPGFAVALPDGTATLNYAEKVADAGVIVTTVSTTKKTAELVVLTKKAGIITQEPKTLNVNDTGNEVAIRMKNDKDQITNVESVSTMIKSEGDLMAATDIGQKFTSFTSTNESTMTAVATNGTTIGKMFTGFPCSVSFNLSNVNDVLMIMAFPCYPLIT